MYVSFPTCTLIIYAVNPLHHWSDFMDFTLANARRFYLSQGDPLALRELKEKKTISLNPLHPKSDFMDITLDNTRRFYSSQGDLLGLKGLTQEITH